jgi:hypothetical protein
VYARHALASTLFPFVLAVSVLGAQPPSGDAVVLPAKLDAEGASQILIPVKIGGHTFWCNADSGGSRALSLDLTKALNAGLQPNATGSNAGVGPDVRRDQRVRGVTVEVGSVTLPDMTIVLVPRPNVVPDIDCIFGLGLLQEYAIEFDYTIPAVRLVPATAFRAAATAVAVPITIDRTATPSAKARLRFENGDVIDATFMVDTGASYYDVVLLKPFLDANRVIERIGPTVPRFSDTPGMALSAARATAFTLGSFEIRGPVTALVSTASGGTFTVDGLVGTGFLRRFKATFDYAHQRLWLEPNGRLQEPQPFDASGLEVRPTEDHGWTIVAVAPNSTAAEAGLEIGDTLTQIDGRAATELTLGDIQALLSRPETTCVVRVNRHGDVRTATLRLRNRL